MSKPVSSKAARPFQPVIATANVLDTGVVVFRTAVGAWSGDVSQAEVAESAEAAAVLQAAAEADQRANKVVDLAIIPVVRDGGALRPAALREIIRASGPTIALPGA